MPAAGQRMNPWMRIAINAFIIVHLYIMATWGMPGWRLRDVLIKPVQKYVIYSGLWHSWDMFSPDPLAINFNVFAEVVYADGSTNIWQFPRMEKLGLAERFQKERYRKWRERVRLDAYSKVWRNTAQYVAREANYQADNPPTRVVLVRQWEAIPPPALEPIVQGKPPPDPKDFQPMPEDYTLTKSYRFHTYFVRPEDLQ